MLEGGSFMTKQPERVILADVFAAVAKATYGPDWPKHVAQKFRVTEDLVTDAWGKNGAPFHVVILIQQDFDRRLREMSEAQTLFPIPPPKTSPTRH